MKVRIVITLADLESVAPYPTARAFAELLEARAVEAGVDPRTLQRTEFFSGRGTFVFEGELNPCFDLSDMD